MVLTAIGDGEAARRPSRQPRSEEQVLGAMAGHAESGLNVNLGGETRYLRPLTIKAERPWKEHVSRAISAAMKAAPVLDDINSNEMVVAMLGGDLDVVLDLVMAFDSLGAGSLNREWLEDNATGIEIRDTLEVLLDSVYPPVAGATTRPARMILEIILAGAAAKSVSAASTNASSPATPGSKVQRTSKRP